MDHIGDWSQLGLSGTIAVSLGGVIAYVFKLFISVQQEAVKRALSERDIERDEVKRLHNVMDERQKDILITLADVSRLMAEVQLIMRERQIKQTVERELDRKGKKR